MERSSELIPNWAESGIGQPEANPHPLPTPQQDIASSDEEEAFRYKYRHETTRTRWTGGRHLFPHPRHAYPLTNVRTVLNIDCVTNTDEVIKEWVKSLLIYQEVTCTEGNHLKTFILLTLGGKVYEWFGALIKETKVRYLEERPQLMLRQSLIRLKMKFDENF